MQVVEEIKGSDQESILTGQHSALYNICLQRRLQQLHVEQRLVRLAWEITMCFNTNNFGYEGSGRSQS